MTVLPYVTAPGNVEKALNGIKSAATPERVSQDFVKTILKIPGGSGDQMTSFLKKVGFTDSDGSPSDQYKKFRNSNTTGKAAADALEAGYSALKKRNEYWHTLPDDELRGLIIEETGQSADSSAVALALACIKAIKKFAKGSEPSSEPKVDSAASLVVSSPAARDGKKSSGLGMNLSYTINLNLPALLAALDPAREARGMALPGDRRPEMTAALQDLYDLVVVLLDTGARRGEIGGLEWRQIDLEARLIRLWRPKVRNESIIYMTERVFEIFSRRHLAAKTPFVFSNKKGGARGHPHQSWRKSFNRAGLNDCTIHTLRHTHATRLIQNGLSVYEVQTVLGHSDPKTTMRYAHLEQAKVTLKARDVIDRLNRSG
jgi:integrase